MRAVDRVYLQAKHLTPEERRELSERLREVPAVASTDESALRAIAYFIEQPRWTPPPEAPTVVDLVREDRAR
jgi:hypothetical protein